MLTSKGGISVLSYHAIYDAGHIDSSNSVSVSLKSFGEQMDWLYKNGYRTLSPEGTGQIVSDTCHSSEKLIHITFDDGYFSHLKYAVDILAKYGFTATLFLSTSFIGRYYTQPDFHFVRHDRQLTWPELRQLLRAGWDIQSHGYTHQRLTHLHTHIINKEVVLSKEAIEYQLGKAVHSFAYPYGIYNKQVVDALKESAYTSAYTVHSGKLCSSSAPFQLPRTMIVNKDNMDTFRVKVATGHPSPLQALRSQLRDIAFATPSLKDFFEWWMHRLGYGNR